MAGKLHPQICRYLAVFVLNRTYIRLYKCWYFDYFDSAVSYVKVPVDTSDTSTQLEH